MGIIQEHKGDINIDGAFGLSTGFVKFDLSPTNTPTDKGTTFWNEDENALQVVLNGYKQVIGGDVFYPVANQSGSSIAKGTAVQFAGTLGASGRLLIVPFLANGSVQSSFFMGVAAETIANGDEGKVLWFGRIRGINTSSFSAGDILYASTTTAGGFQTTVPQAPNNIVQVAAVINSHANQGVIFVRPTIGSNINKDEGVKITTPSSRDVLLYDNAQSLFVNDSLTKSDVGLSNVDNTSDADKPISAATQSALDLKANDADISVVGKSNSYNDLDNLPSLVTQHSELTLDDGTNPHGTTASDVGLGNVDNTSDADKPISTATQTKFEETTLYALQAAHASYVVGDFREQVKADGGDVVDAFGLIETLSTL